MGGKINSIEELKQLAKPDDGCECYIRLNHGTKSSKVIRYFDGTDIFHIIHEIDDSDENMTTDELINSFIGKAISFGALIAY